MVQTAFTRFRADGADHAAFANLIRELLAGYDCPVQDIDPSLGIMDQTGDVVSIAEAICCLEDHLQVPLELGDEELMLVSIDDLASRCGIRADGGMPAS